jgi:hypothetical protein
MDFMMSETPKQNRMFRVEVSGKTGYRIFGYYDLKMRGSRSPTHLNLYKSARKLSVNKEGFFVDQDVGKAFNIRRIQ